MHKLLTVKQPIDGLTNDRSENLEEPAIPDANNTAADDIGNYIVANKDHVRGQYNFLNKSTNVSSGTIPDQLLDNSAFADHVDQEPVETRGLGNGWFAIKDNITGQYFFWNEINNVSTWIRPDLK